MRPGARGFAAVAAVAAAALIGCGSGATAPPAAPAVEPAPAAASAAAKPAPTPAIAPAVTPEPEATPAPSPVPPYRNTVRWSTASEVDNFGYDVYRATNADGPFERLTKDPIPGAGTTDEPQKYSFVDDTIDPHQAYYYYVESISLAGERERFTPVIAAKPKLPPPPSR